MEAVWALAGVAFATVVGYLTNMRVRRSEREQAWIEDLLEACATISAEERNFSAHIAHFIKSGDLERIKEFDTHPRRLAASRMRLLTIDDDLIAADTRLSDAGRAAYIRIVEKSATPKDADTLRRTHLRKLDDFVASTQSALSARKVIH